MAKLKTVFFCSNCGYESPKWMGKCPSCSEWSTFVEELVEKGGSSKYQDSRSFQGSGSKPQPLFEVRAKKNPYRYAG